MQSFGFNTFLTILLPGTILTIAGYQLVYWKWPESDLYWWIISLGDSDFLSATALVLISSLLGSLLSSILGMFEWKLLDALAANNLSIDRDQYDEEWCLYVESLSSTQPNSYLSSKALSYMFEFRAAFSSLILAGVLLIVSPYHGVGIVVLFLALLLGKLAYETHYLLADWRHRSYGWQASINTMGNEKEERDSRISNRTVVFIAMISVVIGASMMYVAWSHNAQNEIHQGSQVYWWYWASIGFSWAFATAIVLSSAVSIQAIVHRHFSRNSNKK